MTNVTVVMVVRGGAATAERALRAAEVSFRDGADRYEVVVVDNGPSRFACSHDVGPAMTVLTARGNVGFARAANLGASVATGNVLVFLNPDTVMSPQAGGRLLDGYASRPQGGAFGARLVDEYGADGAWGGVFHHRWRRIAGRLWPRLARPTLPAEGTVPVDWVAATALLVPRSTWEAVDGFDESYYMYFEDVDLCLRLARRGHPAFVVADAVVTHEGGGTYRHEAAGRRTADYRTSRTTFLRRHARWSSRLVVPLLDLLTRYRYNRPQ